MPGSENDDMKKNVERSMIFVESSNAGWKRYSALPQGDEEKALATPLGAARQAFFEKGVTPLQQALVAGNREEALRLARDVLPDLQRTMAAAHEKLEKFQMNVAKGSFEAAQARFENIRLLSIALILAGIVVAFMAAVMLHRAIVRPVEEALDVFERMARGDLTSRIVSMSKNEVGRMDAGAGEDAGEPVGHRRGSARRHRFDCLGHAADCRRQHGPVRSAPRNRRRHWSRPPPAWRS